MRDIPPFQLQHWAKRRVERAPLSLGTSGISVPGPDVFVPPDVAEPFSSDGNEWGSEELKTAIASFHGVHPDSVLVSDGTSLANFNALLSLARPGERVIVETPTYPSLATIPELLSVHVERLPRRLEEDWLPSLRELDTAASAGPRVAAMVLTRLHNPSGLDLPAAFLEELAALAEARDFFVLLDEVYLDFLEGAQPGHAWSPRFLSTGSLTKAWGFGGLRVGWLIGHPDAIRPAREASYYLAVNGSSWAQAVAVRVIQERDRLLARSREIAARGQAIVGEWIDARNDLEWVPPDGGLTTFVRLGRVPDTATFASRLYAERGVAVAEGELFGLPGWVRLCWGSPEPDLREALRRLGAALDES